VHFYTLRRYLNPVMLTVVLTLISAVLRPNSCHAAGLKDLQKLEKDVSRTVNRSRGLAHAILKRLKEVDESCRDAGGNPIPSQRNLAHQMLGRADALRATFNTNAQQAEDLIDKFDKKYKGIKNRGSGENEIRARVDRFRADPLPTAQLCDTRLALQPLQNNADFLRSRRLPPRLASDLTNDCSRTPL